MIKRRTLLKFFSFYSLGSLIQGTQAWAKLGDVKQELTARAFMLRHGPINRTLVANIVSNLFSGNLRSTPNKELSSASIKAESLKNTIEETDLVIIGGGISGLATCHLLNDLSPIILESQGRMGGNAQGEAWQGIDYSIGSAYLVAADDMTELGSFYKSLGLTSKKDYWKKRIENPVALDSDNSKNIYRSFWSGESVKDANAKVQFKAIKNHLIETLKAEIYPDIPLPEETSPDFAKVAKYVIELDQETLETYLLNLVKKNSLGETIHPHIVSFMEKYCWSSFGAAFSGAQGVSAAAGLNFLAAEMGEIWVMPGGNSAIAQKLLAKILTHKKNKLENLRPNSSVDFVEVQKDGKCLTSYWDQHKNQRKFIRSRAVVMACPKYVVKKVLTQLEPERLAAIEKLKYSNYLVANVLVNSNLSQITEQKSFFEMLLLGKDKSSNNSANGNESTNGMVLANFAIQEMGFSKDKGQSVLSLYKPLQSFAIAENTTASYLAEKSKFQNEIVNEILPFLKMTPDLIKDIRLTYRKQAIPQAVKGLIADGVYQKLRKPFGDHICGKNPIFFVEQDNWALPAIETSLTEAIRFENKIRAVL